MANADSPGGTTDPDSDGQWPDSDLTVTRTIPEEYWQNRQGDLAGTQTVTPLPFSLSMDADKVIICSAVVVVNLARGNVSRTHPMC